MVCDGSFDLANPYDALMPPPKADLSIVPSLRRRHALLPHISSRGSACALRIASAGLVRTTETIDSKIAGQKDAVKFCFVTYLGSELGAMRKGKITTFKGTVTEAFAPFHVELLNATSAEEVSTAAIVELLGSMFGTATAASSANDGTMRIGQRTVKINEGGKQRVGLQSTAVTSKQEVGFPTELASAIADVRADTSPIDWCLCRLEDASALVMVGTGSGGVSKLASALTSDHAYYGLVRTTEAIDGGVRKVDAVKFCFITFLGEGLSVLKKGKIATLKGTITHAFEPFHVELLNATVPEEVTLNAISSQPASMFGSATDASDGGTSLRVGQRTIKVVQGRNDAATLTSGTPRMPGAAGGVGGGGVTPRAASEALPADVAAAIARVRSDADPTEWCVFGYDNAKQPAMVVVKEGSGSLEALQSYLDISSVLYALVRVTQQIDASATIKFVLVSWVGDEVAPMRKARLSTLRGSATSALGPFHAEMLNPTEASAITLEALLGLLEPAALQ